MVPISAKSPANNGASVDLDVLKNELQICTANRHISILHPAASLLERRYVEHRMLHGGSV